MGTHICFLVRAPNDVFGARISYANPCPAARGFASKIRFGSPLTIEMPYAAERVRNDAWENTRENDHDNEHAPLNNGEKVLENASKNARDNARENVREDAR